MNHRHIDTGEWSLMAIESLFDRGSLTDWQGFSASLRGDIAIAHRALRVTKYREPDGSEGIARALIAHYYPAFPLPPIDARHSNKPSLFY